MDILKTFTIGDDATEINVQGSYDVPLFQASHIGKALGIVNARDAVRSVPTEFKVYLSTDTLGGRQEACFLREQGLYWMVMRSKKKVAEAFQKWVANIVTELRANGTYSLTARITDLQKQNKLDLKMAELHADRMRHDFLRNSMIYAKESLVYLGKIKELDDGRTICKFGETGNIQVRGNGLRFEHAELGELVLVDVWPCHRCKDFENFILKHPVVVPNRCYEQVRGRNARELVYISSAFTVEQLRALILANIEDFQGFTREQVLEKKRLDIEEEHLRLENQKMQMHKDLEERRLDLLKRMLDAITAPNISRETASLLNDVSQILKGSNAPADEPEPGPEPEHEVSIVDEPGPTNSNTIDEEHNPYIPRPTNPCVQKYDADLELVEVYETIREAARRNPIAKTFDITSAISNNTLYLGCRWTMVARENKDVLQTLEPTRNSTKRIRDKVAKIDPATGRIVALFPDGAAAAVSLAMGKGAVTTAIAKNDGVLAGSVWRYWGDCTAEEQASYEGDVADVSTAGSAKRVRQLDPETGTVVKTWTNMQELILAFKTSQKTINKKTADGSVFKGFRWQITD